MMKTSQIYSLSPVKEKPVDNWQVLASYFERDGIPLSETELSVQVFGVYSIPEEWIKLDNSGSVETWSYQVKLSDVHLSEGKINQRELTDEEKKEIENKAKNKNKTNSKKPEEPNASELERIERERLEKEEKDRKFQEEWDLLDEQGRFYKKKETPTEEPWISFPNGKNISYLVKSGSDLIELEDDINTNNGLMLKFFKVPPVDEDPKKRPKPKGISIDEVKPINCVAWVDLSEFHYVPGLKEVTLRANLMLEDTYEKKMQSQIIYDKSEQINSSNNNNNNNINNSNNNSKNIENENFDDLEVKDPNLELNDESNVNKITDYVLNKGTYIYFKVSFSNPINPELPAKSLPDPDEMIKREEKQYTQITPAEICNDFRKQLKIAIESISKVYTDYMGDAKNQLLKKDKSNLLSNVRKEERDANIAKFYYNFNVSGKADTLKEKLKRFIVRIIREKYNKKSDLRGVFRDNRDMFYSELYAYLTDEIKLSMDEYILEKKDELHEHVISSYEQSRKEVMNYAARINKEVKYKI